MLHEEQCTDHKQNSHIAGLVRELGTCLFTGDVIQRPVALQCCGNIFDRKHLLEWIILTPTCPLCRATVNESSMVNLRLGDLFSSIGNTV